MSWTFAAGEIVSGTAVVGVIFAITVASFGHVGSAAAWWFGPSLGSALWSCGVSVRVYIHILSWAIFTSWYLGTKLFVAARGHIDLFS